MRINKFFTEHGFCSRREADRIIEAGRVSINQARAKLGDQVEEGDKVFLDGKELVPPDKTPIIIAYHKPIGIECTSDERVENNIINAVNYPERLVHIGRLDLMSEGLILLTNLGDIVNKILRRRFAHEKEYVVIYDRLVTYEDVRLLGSGLDIGDPEGPTLPCKVTQIGSRRIQLILTEGRNRQIRRMSEAVGLKVIRLKRVRVMNIKLGELKKGTWRHLTSVESKELLDSLALVE